MLGIKKHRCFDCHVCLDMELLLFRLPQVQNNVHRTIVQSGKWQANRPIGLGRFCKKSPTVHLLSCNLRPLSGESRLEPVVLVVGACDAIGYHWAFFMTLHLVREDWHWQSRPIKPLGRMFLDVDLDSAATGCPTSLWSFLISFSHECLSVIHLSFGRQEIESLRCLWSTVAIRIDRKNSSPFCSLWKLMGRQAPFAFKNGKPSDDGLFWLAHFCSLLCDGAKILYTSLTIMWSDAFQN